uniref:Reverse transcriptase N-terminal domain-containing protein n=1 Tax=Gracilaria vermiculophylla TaxID=2608709 RepID=A0A345U8X3_9FLOR|nr:hypothetical protein [Gracilaria vermiculophylla]AXI96909.1 hypothetical protein [Gracilaria vermiculophylla]WDZ67959.1 hypothetical protein [Gracilaria vermiculophylla]
MTSYIIDEETKWKYLPWNHIKQRVNTLKYRIYQASKLCDKHLIYKTQNNLVNSNEAKILAIQDICKSIKDSYICWDKENYNLFDKFKARILSLLFNYKHSSNLCKSIQSLLNKIEQYIIFLCLESEWKARFRYIFNTNLHNDLSYRPEYENVISNDYLLSTQNNFLVNFKLYIPSKYINLIYIKKKFILFHISFLV